MSDRTEGSLARGPGNTFVHILNREQRVKADSRGGFAHGWCPGGHNPARQVSPSIPLVFEVTGNIAMLPEVPEVTASGDKREWHSWEVPGRPGTSQAPFWALQLSRNREKPKGPCQPAEGPGAHGMALRGGDRLKLRWSGLLLQTAGHVGRTASPRLYVFSLARSAVLILCVLP